MNLLSILSGKMTETIKVYEHYFDEEKHREAHDKMLESMAELEKEYIEQNEK